MRNETRNEHYESCPWSSTGYSEKGSSIHSYKLLATFIHLEEGPCSKLSRAVACLQYRIIAVRNLCRQFHFHSIDDGHLPRTTIPGQCYSRAQNRILQINHIRHQKAGIH